jgi:hypothetical protein
MGVRSITGGARRPQARTVASRNIVAAADAGPISPMEALSISPLEHGILLSALIIGSGIYLSYPEYVPIANLIIPFAIIIGLGVGCFRMARGKVATILTPVFCFRVSLIFYSGFGSLVPILGGEEELAVLQAFFYFTEIDHLKFNIVNVIFIMSINFSTVLANSILHRIKLHSHDLSNISRFIEPSNISLLVVGLAILIMGSFVYFVFILPFQFGIDVGTIPQALAQIALSSLIGLFLCTIWSLQNRPRLAWLFVSIAVLMSAIGLTTYSKSDVVLPLIMIGAAYIYARPTVSRSLIWLVIILGSFAISQPVTSHGRMVLLERYGSIEGPAGLGERTRIIVDYYTEPVEIRESEANYATIRFSYVNIGTFAITEADSGNYVDTYSRAWAIFIPRFLWPEKPNMTQIGRDINFAITGNDQSAVGTGLSAEAYWNGGFPMVCLGGIVIGTLLWLWSIYSIQVQVIGAWHLFPIILLGIRSGVRSDGMFVLDILGPIFVAFFGHIILTFGNRLIQRFRSG